jgi:FkbM family methyltransferase
MKQNIKSNLKRFYNRLFLSVFQRELLNLKGKDNGGKIVFLENEFSYHHGQAFLNTYNELFNQNIYKFNLKKTNPVIIDCGANMGLSVLYFAKTYPDSKIIAFEPDESVLPYLKQNIKTYELSNVLLYEKAVWSSNTILSFYSDQGMGGRLELNYNNQAPKKVEAIRLKEFLDKEVDFLKIDIEGAEMEVLIDCEDKLRNVNNLFVEYHSFENSEQQLGELLNLLKRNGFKYHLRQSFSRLRPFVDKNLVCENYDMAINVFAYRN